MDMLTLQASARDLGVKATKVRQSGRVPAVVYGSVDGNLHLEIEAAALHKTFNKAGSSTLVELDVNGKKVPVLFKEVTFHPISDRETHVDFYAVDMKKEIEAPVPVIFEGESPAVKELSAILVTGRNTVLVRSLPSDLPHSLSVSIASLATLNDVLTVKDLQLPKGVKVVDAPETVLMSVQEQRAEEVVATPTAEEVAAAAAAAAPTGGGPIPGQTEGADKPAAEAAAKDAKAKK